jgi:hypothetical protein
MAGIVSLALLAGVCRAQQAKPTMEQILAVWKARQDKVTSARFDMSREETIHRGSTSLIDRERRRMAGMPLETEPNPPRDYLVKGTSGVSLDGAKLRYSYDHQQWDPRGKKLYAEQYVDVFDGEFFKFLQDPASGQDSHASAAVRKHQASESALQFPILPLILAFRGVHPQFFRDLPKFEITGKIMAISGRPCLELVRDAGPPGQREFLYLDQNRSYVVVKEMIVHGGPPECQLDLTYAADELVGWVPKSWEYVMRFGKDHQFVNSGRNAVLRYELNPAMDESEFDIVFPPGTLVHNETSGDDLLSVVQDNGESGTELAAGLDPSYEALRKAGPPTNRWMLVTVSGVAFALALGGWICFRQWRLRRMAETNPAEKV